MLASSIHKVRGRTVDQVNRFRSHSCAVEANLSASNLPGAAYKQHPQSTRRNNFPGEQIPEWYRFSQRIFPPQTIQVLLILAETLSSAVSFSSPWRGKRRVFERRKPVLIDQLQPSTNADKLSG
jgi:hypothetical protein